MSESTAHPEPRRPRYLITIDTEGDDQWSRPRPITTRNAGYLLRFQTLCERYGLKPTYLTNYEMASSQEFVEFGRDMLARGAGEIGMHLHAWHSPPDIPRTDNDLEHQPYLIEYPELVLRQKLAVMTELLEQTFERKMVSHRAGRWGFNELYARALADLGYLVDCSVTPLVSWRSSLGAPDGSGGPDFRHFPSRAYFLDLDDISRPGNSPLLELPVTIMGPQSNLGRWLHGLARHAPGFLRMRGIANRVEPEVSWLRPKGHNLARMLWIQDQAIIESWDYVEFMLHSSELMPAGSPTFSTEASIEALYSDLDCLFSAANGRFEGMTLGEYRREFAA